MTMKAEQLNAAKYAVNEQIAELEDWLGRNIEDGLSPEITAARKNILAGQRAALKALEEMPPTPGDLDARLSESITTENAVGIYKHALSMAKRYDTVKKSALTVARAAIEPGVRKVVTTFGNCGWTQPKRKVLDKHTWLQAIADDEKLAQAQDALDAAKFALDEAQAPYMVDAEPRFYIR
jgi:hypothetical protein